MTNRRTYVVTRITCGHTMSLLTAKTFPKAARDFRSAVYDLHNANATLDRPIAHRDIATAEKLTSDCVAATLERFDSVVTLQVL